MKSNHKSILCPNCHAHLTVGVDAIHASDLSLTCRKCSGIVFPVTVQQDNTINKSGNPVFGK